MPIDEAVANAPQNQIQEQTASPNSIDDVVDEYIPNPDPDTLDKKLELDKETSKWGIVKDILKYSPFLAAQALLLGPIATLTTGITSIGFLIGGYFEAKKRKKKYTWRRKRRDIYSGNILGWVDYVVFKVPDYFGKFIPYLGGAGLLNKIAKTLFFDALILPAAVASYKVVEYVRDSIGWGRFFKGFFNFKIFRYIKDTYRNSLKGKVVKSTANLWKIIPFLHYIQLTCWKSVQARMAQSAIVNNPVIRYTLGDREKMQPKIAKQPAASYNKNPNIIPYPQQNQYRKVA